MNKYIFFIVSVIVGLCLCEAVFRTAFLKDKVPTTEQDFFRLVSSSWPKTILVEKKPDTYRILGLADSFGVAGQESNYHYFLESFLKDKGIKVELINYSVREYGLFEELTLLRRFAASYHPDLVLHGVCVGNDLDMLYGRLMEYKNISIRVKNPLWFSQTSNFSLLEWLYRYIKYRFECRRLQNEYEKNKSIDSFSEERFLEIGYKRMAICSLQKNQASRRQKVIQLLDEIRNEAARIKATYIMVIHPDQFQVEQDLQNQIITKYKAKKEDYDFKLPQEFLKNYCRSRGILYIDLLPVFISGGLKGGLYLKRDTHYNTNGNKLAAKAVYEFLQNQNLFINTQSDKGIRR